MDSSLLLEILSSIVEAVKKDEPQITKYDTIAGDGDCGETLLKGVNGTFLHLNIKCLHSADDRFIAVQQRFSKTPAGPVDLVTVIREISTTVEQSMGGTSGAIYAIFFNAVANALSKNAQNPTGVASIPSLLSGALAEGLDELCRYTAARKGHKTLMDALIPFVETFAQKLDFANALNEAHSGAEGTRKLDAVLGRASYVSKEHIEREGGIPDPGALGVVTVLRGIQDVLKE